MNLKKDLIPLVQAAKAGNKKALEATGQIMTTITRNNLPISKSVNYGLWGWSSRLKDVT